MANGNIDLIYKLSSILNEKLKDEKRENKPRGRKKGCIGNGGNKGNLKYSSIEDKKEAIRERQRQYDDSHAQLLSEKRKQYYEQNKDIIDLKNRIKYYKKRDEIQSVTGHKSDVLEIEV